MQLSRDAQADMAAEVSTVGEIAVCTPANKGSGCGLVVIGAD